MSVCSLQWTEFVCQVEKCKEERTAVCGKCLSRAQADLYQTDIRCFSLQSAVKTRSVCCGHECICIKQTFAASVYRVQSRPEVFVVGTSVFVSNRHLLLQSTEYKQDQKYLLWARADLLQTEICCFNPAKCVIKTRSVCCGHELTGFKQKFAASIQQSV